MQTPLRTSSYATTNKANNQNKCGCQGQDAPLSEIAFMKAFEINYKNNDSTSLFVNFVFLVESVANTASRIFAFFSCIANIFSSTEF